MYLPLAHAWSGECSMQDHIDRHPLGAWVCTTSEGLVANHIPVVHEDMADRLGTVDGLMQDGSGVSHAIALGVQAEIHTELPKGN